MTDRTLETSLLAATRTAGLLYLIIAILGIFSIGYMPSIVFVFGDAATTADNILAHQGLLRAGIFADIAILWAEVALSAILYSLLKPVNKTLSLIAVLSRLAMVLVMGINLLNYMVPLVLLSGADYLNAFDADQLQSLAMLFLEVHEYGVYVWQIFFGLHLVALGYLVLKSGYFPRVLGAMMMVGSFGYTFQSLEKFVFPGNEALSMLVIGLLTIVTIGEVLFLLWLLFKGVNMQRWEQRVG